MGSSVHPTIWGWLVEIGALLVFIFLMRECFRHGRSKQWKQPKWARDDGAEIKQGPLYGDEAAGYVEAKLERGNRL